MKGKDRYKPYKIIGAYDSETTNLVHGACKRAFPILHQLGVLSVPVEQVNARNVETYTHIDMYRHTVDLYERLDEITEGARGYVPVIACHNLAFDMYSLADYLSGKQARGLKVRVLAKSVRKPITFTVCDEQGSPALVIWDTLVFSQKSLAYMGEECGYPKLKGDWDYDLIRTPKTPLSEKEVAYAKHDIYALLAWLGHWCRLNPDIKPSMLGLKVVTKTGVVRQRRYQRFGRLTNRRGGKVRDYWAKQNIAEMFRTDDELFTFNACTRGGMTFCAANHASQVFDYSPGDGRMVYGYDATSQHPAQIVSHRYPEKFVKVDAGTMGAAFDIVADTTLCEVLDSWEKPFPVAFCGCFKFTNIRLKKGSVFEREGVAPLASARFKPYESDPGILDGNQDGEEFKAEMGKRDYADHAMNPVFAFGKLFSADSCKVWITELAAWEIAQAYEWDSVTASDGYATGRFARPTDMSVISVMQFYGAKAAFKAARSYYHQGERMPEELQQRLKGYNVPAFVIDGMADGSIDEETVEGTYLGLKADLNALFGIEACNEYRRDTVLGSDGIAYDGDFGICNAPKRPKAWYQCGQRIVGWSRIAQTCVLMLAAPYAEGVVNGDTDSVKFAARVEDVPLIDGAMHRLGKAIDAAKKGVCSRVKVAYPKMYHPLEGIGHYIREFEVTRFCASWNKAYCMDDGGKLRFTVAGIPTVRRDGDGAMIPCLASIAHETYARTGNFGEICDTYLGYNVTYPPDLTGLNARSFPEWGEMFTGRVTDHLGNTSIVAEPSALCLYGMAKTVNDTRNPENRANLEYAAKNRASVNTGAILLTESGFVDVNDLLGGAGDGR